MRYVRVVALTLLLAGCSDPFYIDTLEESSIKLGFWRGVIVGQKLTGCQLKGFLDFPYTTVAEWLRTNYEALDLTKRDYDCKSIIEMTALKETQQ